MDGFFARRQPQARRLALALGLGSLLTASAGWAAPPAAGAAETFGIEGPAAPKSAKPVRPTPSEKRGVAFGTLPEVRLLAVDRDALLKADAAAYALGKVKALRYGVGRDVQLTVQDGDWFDLADGSRLWAGEIVSTDALGLRLHFKGVHLPDGAELAVYSPASVSGSSGVAKNGSTLFDPERHVEFHEGSAVQAADFWTGTFYGERARVEYLAPAGAAAELPFTVDRLQHLYLDPVQQLAKSIVGEKDAAGACENDVTCYPQWANVARAVAGIGVAGEDALFCSGQLLNTQAQDFTPYYLTANHCLSSQADAASSEIYWLYQTSTCNGTPPAIDTVPQSVGTTLVSTNTTSDYTLLLVNGALPSGLYWAGWTGVQVPDGIAAVAVHHPSGDYKRISFGNKAENSECYQFEGTNGLSLVRTVWNNGVTEPGSSGSGIYRADTQQLYGQLFFGPSACGVAQQDLFDCYGAFFTTYTRIKSFLKAGSDDSSEPNNACTKARIVRTGNLNSRIVKVSSPDWYKILVPAHRTATVTLHFTNADGDVDLAGFTKCGASPAVTSTGTGDSETITLTNSGKQAAYAIWQVYLSSSTRNVYNMTVAVH
jgi:hypothetical protein